MINQNWILLDSESTISNFSNKKFLQNIRHCGTQHSLRVHSNGGHQDTHMIGDLPGFGPVWYNPVSLANILSLAAVRKICRVTMDSWKEAAMIVHKHNGDEMKFIESSSGLYYHDVKPNKSESTNYSLKDTKDLDTRSSLALRDVARESFDVFRWGNGRVSFTINTSQRRVLVQGSHNRN